MNEIVKIHNDLTDLPLKGFNASEIDVLMGLCYKLKDKGASEIIVNLHDFQELTDYSAKDREQFIRSVKDTNKKLLNLNLEIEDNHKVTQFVLFNLFEIDKDKNTLRVQVNQPFKYILNNLTGNYTSLELQQAVHLSSKYSKNIFKKLCEFRSTGKWVIRLEDFKEYLDVPKSYRISNIDQFIVNPSLDELKSIFPELKVNKTYQKSPTGKGRPKVTGYEWTFKPVVSEKKPTEPTQESISEVTGWIKTGKFCPLCHRPVYKKQFENENGIYWMYGHADWKTGKCNFKTYDIADLIEEYQLREPEPASAEQRENKKKLGNLIGNLFK